MKISSIAEKAPRKIIFAGSVNLEILVYILVVKYVSEKTKQGIIVNSFLGCKTNT